MMAGEMERDSGRWGVGAREEGREEGVMVRQLGIY